MVQILSVVIKIVRSNVDVQVCMVILNIKKETNVIEAQVLNLNIVHRDEQR